MAAAGGGVQPLMTFPLLQPCDIAVNYQTVNPTAAAVAQGDKPASQGVVTTSDLVLSLSPAVMQLVMRTAVQLQMTLGQAAPPTVRTQRYVLLHSGCKEHQEDGVETRPTGVSTTGLAFWRPVPVAGYCAVGDLVTSGGAFRPPPRPLRAATLLRDSVALVWPPVAYRRVWCDPAAGLGLWEPIAAEGFIALGCGGCTGCASAAQPRALRATEAALSVHHLLVHQQPRHRRAPVAASELGFRRFLTWSELEECHGQAAV
jgi:hypothetical protein